MSIWKNMVRPSTAGWASLGLNGWSKLEDDYEVGKMLGKGSYGTVRLVLERRTSRLWACKTISKSRLTTKRDVEDVRREVELLNLLTPHANVAGVHRVYEDREAVHILMDYCEGGELFERITAKGTFSEQEAARMFLEMAEVVRHCHGMGVIHRDIKPENFLLTDRTDACGIKACDFGLSTYFKPGEISVDLVGSAYYVAPEVLHRRYGPQCDLWSLGVVLYILLCGLPPFWGNSEREIFDSILRGHLDFETRPWPSISPEAKCLVRGLLNPDPGARLSLADLAEDPWLKERGGRKEAPLPPIVILRMKSFAAMTKLKKAAVLCAAKYLNPEQIQGLRELFKSFDKNGDGVVSFEELQEGLRTRQPDMPFPEMQQVMTDVDLDGSGSIDYEEFLAATANLSQLEREETFIKAFRDMDQNGDGTLTANEVLIALGRSGEMSEEEAHELISCHDLNRDGVIDYAEFVAMLRSNAQHEGLVELRRPVHRKRRMSVF